MNIIKNTKEIRNAVIAGVILLPLTLMFEKVRMFFGDVINFFKWFILTSKSVPIWMITALVLFSLLSLLFLLSKLRSPKWTLYKEDNFDGLIWRWNYSVVTNEILRPHPYCPKDDTILVYSYPDVYYHTQILFNCETCRSKYGPYNGDIVYNRERIIRQIDRKIRNGDFKERITN